MGRHSAADQPPTAWDTWAEAEFARAVRLWQQDGLVPVHQAPMPQGTTTPEGTEPGAYSPWDGLGWVPAARPAPAGYTVPVCGRCGAQRPISYGAKIGCGECGHLWQADPSE